MEYGDRVVKEHGNLYKNKKNIRIKKYKKNKKNKKCIVEKEYAKII